MSAASEMIAKLYDVVWAFEAREQLRHGVRPATEITVDTHACRIEIAVCFEDDAEYYETVVDVRDDWLPRTVTAATASFAQWCELHERIVAGKTTGAAHKRGVRQAKEAENGRR